MASNENGWLRRSMLRPSLGNLKNKSPSSPKWRNDENLAPNYPLSFFTNRNRPAFSPETIQKMREALQQDMKKDQEREKIRQTKLDQRRTTMLVKSKTNSNLKKPVKRLSNNNTKPTLTQLWRKSVTTAPATKKSQSMYIPPPKPTFHASTFDKTNTKFQPNRSLVPRIKTEPQFKKPLDLQQPQKPQRNEPVLKSLLKVRRQLSEVSLGKPKEENCRQDRMEHVRLKAVKKVNFGIPEDSETSFLPLEEDLTYSFNNLNGTYQPKKNLSLLRDKSVLCSSISSQTWVSTSDSTMQEPEFINVAVTQKPTQINPNKLVSLFAEKEKLEQERDKAYEIFKRMNKLITECDNKIKDLCLKQNPKLEAIVEENSLSEGEKVNSSFEQNEEECGVLRNKLTKRKLSITKEEMEQNGGYMTRNRAKAMYIDLQRSFNLSTPVKDTSLLMNTTGRTPDTARSRRKSISLKVQSQLEQLFS